MTETPEAAPSIDIAVIGMGSRVPGAASPRKFYENLCNGVESLREFTEEELIEAGEDPALVRDPNYVPRSGVLDNVEMFDAGFFGFSPKDASIMDPQHRHFLECAWETLEDCGHTPDSFDGRVGVYGGSGHNTYFFYNLLSNPQLAKSVGLFLLRHTGNDKDFLSTRVSYELDLTGPSVNVQTACSTSLVAIHLGVQSLLADECDLALAGGVTILVPHERGYVFQEGEVLSPDGHCRAFDINSKGTIFGSGTGLVALRRLDDAIADGDHIYGVIKGSAINNDGKMKVGYLAPSVDGHADAIAEALALAGLEADAISYAEAHGTGTSVGDPIEIQAFTQAYSQTTKKKQFARIGSVKTNIGHLDTAAGVMSFIKVMMSLANEKLPPTLNFTAPNPMCDFENSPFSVCNEIEEWPRKEGDPRYAGVSSLGVGGTNAHIVVGEAPVREPTGKARPWRVLVQSARSDTSLNGASERLAEYLRQHPDVSLDDVAYTHQVGRKVFDCRRIVAFKDRDDLLEVLESGDKTRVVTKTESKQGAQVAFMFPGGGAQYPNMGLDLYVNEPVYRREFDRCLALAKDKHGVDIRSLIFPEEGQEKEAAKELQSPLNSIMSVFITEYSLACLLLDWGVEPAAMTGHSLGEYTVACLAGVMSLESAIGLVATRGALFLEVDEGAMLSVPLSPEEVKPYVRDGLGVAVFNGPSLCVLSGRIDAIEAAEKHLESDEIDAQRVRVKVAAHSPMLDPVLDRFREFCKTIEYSAPQRPFISNLSGDWAGEEVATPEYWVRHLRETVCFSQGMAKMLDTAEYVLLEVGPGTGMCSLARQHVVPGSGQGIVNAMRHPKETFSDSQAALTALGRLWVEGVDVDWKAYHGTDRRLRLSLPTYAFDHKRHWVDPGKAAALTGSGATFERMENLADWFYQPVWKNRGYEAVATTEPLTILAFVDSTPLGKTLVKRLRQAKHRVITVEPGDAFFRLRDDAYVVAAENRDDYTLLAEDLLKGEVELDRVAHMWTLTQDETARPGSSFFHRNLEHGFYSLLFIAQALFDEDSLSPSHMAVVGNGTQQVTSEIVKYPEKAMVLGPCKVIPKEYPGVSCTYIDLDVDEFSRGGRRIKAGDLENDAFRDFVEDLITPSSDEVVARRRGERWVQVFERTPINSSESDGRLKDEGVYLVTGGIGGIGYVQAKLIASSCRAKLVLLGRSEMPEPESWDDWLSNHSQRDPVSLRIQKVRELEKLGAEVLAVSADVSNVEQMSAAVNRALERFGRIDGVVHAAGVIDDGVIALKTQVDIDHVFTPKLHGTMVLHDLLSAQKMDFFVVFSSTSSVLGNAGQVDYTAANAFLNAFAQRNNSISDTYYTAINWGIWRDIGMAAQALSNSRRDHDPDLISTEEVRHPLLGRTLSQGQTKVVFGANYRTRDLWALSEHRTKTGMPLIPGTGFIEMARAAVTEKHPNEIVEISDLFLLQPLDVDEDAPCEVRVQMQYEDDQTYDFEVRSANADGEWRQHVQATVTALPAGETELETVDVDAIKKRCTNGHVPYDPKGIRSKQETNLRFGARWRNLKEQHFGSGEALALLELPEEFEADLESFLVHPAMLDQAAHCGLPLIEGYDKSSDLFIPFSFKRVRIYGAFTRVMHSHVRPSGTATAESDVVDFDIRLINADGQVVGEINGFSVKRMPVAEAFAAASTAASQALGGNSGGGDSGSAQERLLGELLEAGIRPVDGSEAFRRIVGSCDVPQVVVTSVDLEVLREEMNSARASEDSSEGKFSRPELASDFVEARDDYERTLVEFWEELLGVDKVGVKDNFFELGGYSLIAVRLFSKIKKKYEVEYPLSTLFEAPTIEECAALIREELGATEGEAVEGEERVAKKHSLLVPLVAGANTENPPFFLVAGMFGNIMNLRHLAEHIGTDHQTYGIQARGLFGNEKPHDDFRATARDYLEQIREVQPHGPYFLGGFSGGGITAYEMALQLVAEGEEVGSVVLLDTPNAIAPTLSSWESKKFRLMKLKRRGLGDFVKSRLQREWERVAKLFTKSEADESEDAGRPTDFRSEQVGAAFMTAVRTYSDQQPYHGKITLFRPEWHEPFELGQGRRCNHDGEVLDHQNHWGEVAAGGIDVCVVPGDHDSMVLEPHVRVLAGKIRETLRSARSDVPVGAGSE